MITSSVLFGIAIALSGSIAMSSFEFGNATNSIKGNQFVDTGWSLCFQTPKIWHLWVIG